MRRREFLERLASAAAASTLPALNTGCRGNRPTKSARPNVLLIMTDDLGYGDLTSTGRTDYHTPRIDSIARDGMQLSNAYSAAPVCTPTRVALMTGRYPARNPIGLYEPLTTQPTGLATEPATLPRLLKDAGYETALIGKWHLGVPAQFHPLRHGFDEFYGFLGAAADYTSHVDTEALTPLFYDGLEKVRVEGYLTDLFTSRAVQYLTRAHDKPFFLNLQYNAPHWPWQAPGDPPYPDSMRWRKGGSPETFARMMEDLDQGVGKVLAALEQNDLARNTLVIFTSDNGGERFSHMGPFSQGKMTLWEGGIRVAAFARWPGVIAAGRTSDQVCITMDWTATMLALAGTDAEPGSPLDGLDLMPALTGGSVVPRDLYWRIFQRSKQKALRSGDYKYLTTAEGEFLFHLAADAGEKNDRKVNEPGVLAELKQKYARWEGGVLAPIPLDPRYA
jgi:arylsulfatase A-like enzyme